MEQILKLLRLFLAATALPLAWPVSALATNGYFSHGYGVRSQAVAGVGIALPQDALAVAANPAGTAFVGDRLDAGLTWFGPERGAEIKGNLAGADGDYSANGTRHFLIPEVGYTRQLSSRWAVGLAAYGNGGMNSDYRHNPFAAFGSSGDAGVDLVQFFVSPSVAFRPHPDHAFGAAVTLAYQRFEAKGLQAFDNPVISATPGAVTNRGHDVSTGWGLKLGWTGQVLPNLTLGAAWSSRIQTEEFDKYKGLFTGSGGFDIPATYGVRLAWQATPALTLAADWQRIEYSSVESVGNPVQVLFSGHQLGSPQGAGFGWQDISVAKLGVVYKHNERLTLRAGYSHAGRPIPRDQTLFNVLAPGVVRDHFSLGASWAVVGGGEWSLSYTHSPEASVSGRDSLPPAFGGGEVDLAMKQNSLGLAYTWRL